MGIQHYESGVSTQNSKLIRFDQTDNLNLGAGGYHSTTFQPEFGKIWEIKAMRLQLPNPFGATAGYHTVTITTVDLDIIKGGSTFDKNIDWNLSEWSIANYSQIPSDPLTYLYALTNTMFSYERPLVVSYYNGSNVSANAARYYGFHLLEKSAME